MTSIIFKQNGCIKGLKDYDIRFDVYNEFDNYDNCNDCNKPIVCKAPKHCHPNIKTNNCNNFIKFNKFKKIRCSQC